MKEWSNELKIKFMEKVVYEAFKKAQENEEFLFVAEMFIEYSSINENEVENKLIQIINKELKQENLSKWQDDNRGIKFRRSKLSNLLIGIERRKEKYD